MARGAASELGRGEREREWSNLFLYGCLLSWVIFRGGKCQSVVVKRFLVRSGN